VPHSELFITSKSRGISPPHPAIRAPESWCSLLVRTALCGYLYARLSHRCALALALRYTSPLFISVRDAVKIFNGFRYSTTQAPVCAARARTHARTHQGGAGVTHKHAASRALPARNPLLHGQCIGGLFVRGRGAAQVHAACTGRQLRARGDAGVSASFLVQLYGPRSCATRKWKSATSVGARCKAP
jgi:hypothetical protein